MATIKYKINNVGTNVLDIVWPKNSVSITNLTGICGGVGTQYSRPYIRGQAKQDNTGSNYTSTGSKIYYQGTTTPNYSSISISQGTDEEGGEEGDDHCGGFVIGGSFLYSSYGIVMSSAERTLYFIPRHDGQQYTSGQAILPSSACFLNTGITGSSNTVIYLTGGEYIDFGVKTNETAASNIKISSMCKVEMAPLARANYGRKTSLN